MTRTKTIRVIRGQESRRRSAESDRLEAYPTLVSGRSEDNAGICTTSTPRSRAPPSLLEDHRLVTLGQRLMKELRAKAERKTITTKDEDKIAYDEFYGWKSKPVIDEIDRVLAVHYALTAEELDFIINYDIKYRLGRNAGEEEG